MKTTQLEQEFSAIGASLKSRSFSAALAALKRVISISPLSPTV